MTRHGDTETRGRGEKEREVSSVILFLAASPRRPLSASRSESSTIGMLEQL
jgi:hypothetical protein